MKFRVLAAVAAALLSATVAQATDLPNKKAPPAGPTVKSGPYNWTGFYAGIGGGASNIDVTDEGNAVAADDSLVPDAGGGGGGGPGDKWCANHPNNPNFDKFCSGGGGGGGGGGTLTNFGSASGPGFPNARQGFVTATAGYDYQVGQFVYGGFADVNFGKSKVSSSVTETFDATFDEITLDSSVSVGNSADLALRAGYLVTNSTLLYVLGGVAGADINAESTVSVTPDTNYPDSPFTAGKSGWRAGYMLGAGAETFLTQNITLRAEYRYSDYGTVSFNADSPSCADASPTSCISVSQDAKVTAQSLRAVLAYRF